jgi:anti-anti-sigma factor
VQTILKARPDVVTLDVPWTSLHFAQAQMLKREVEVLGRACNRVLADLSGVSFVDITGCGAFLQAHRGLLERGGRLGLCCPRPSVRALFALLRLQRVLGIFPTREQGLRELSPGNRNRTAASALLPGQSEVRQVLETSQVLRTSTVIMAIPTSGHPEGFVARMAGE